MLFLLYELLVNINSGVCKILHDPCSNFTNYQGYIKFWKPCSQKLCSGDAQRMNNVSAYLHDILLDNLRIVANRFDEKQFESHLYDHHVVDDLSAFGRRVGGIEDGDFSAGLEPLADVLQRLDGALRSNRHRFRIVRAEEFMALVSSRFVSAVFP